MGRSVLQAGLFVSRAVLTVCTRRLSLLKGLDEIEGLPPWNIHASLLSPLFACLLSGALC